MELNYTEWNGTEHHDTSTWSHDSNSMDLHDITLRANSSYLIWQHPPQNQLFKKRRHLQLFSTRSEVYYDIDF